MKRPGLLPPDQQAAVVRALYTRADSEGWATLSPGDRSRFYSGWVEDPAVGAVLTQYMTPEAARAWIKDGPMKEYARASRGAGRYAAFGRHGGTTPLDVVRLALGEGATIESGSSRLKPFSCRARTAVGDLVFVTWGETRNFRDLLWAALKVAAAESVPARIVVMDPPGYVTTNDERKRQQAIADRCDIALYHMREVLGTRSDGVAP